MRWSRAFLLLVAACGARTELATVGPSDASSHDVVISVVDATSPDVVAKPLCSGGPTLLAPTTLAAEQLTLDDTTVFFAGLDGVYSVPKAGGAVTSLVTPKSVTPFVVRATDVVWKSQDIDSVYLWSTPKGGGAASPVLTEPVSFGGFAGAPNGLFVWGSEVTNNQLLLFTPPATVTPVTKVPLDTIQIIEDEGTIYAAALGGVTALGTNGKVKFIATGPLGNGTMTFANLMNFDAANVYFISVTDYHSSAIVSAPKAGGGPSAVLAQGQDYNPSFSDLALDGTHLYYVEEYAKQGNVVRIALDGSDRTVVATDPKGILKVAVDATSVYWTATDGVYCQAK